MKIYLVGGAVRDELLGLPVAERDWVVVGGDVRAMRARGFVPLDRDFPVFAHPETGEEYALARREVKRGEGYRGFDIDAGPDVALEEDLHRRDLTINAMARAADGTVIDPYAGCADLAAGLLRHVSPAFVEDPVRVLRIARFAAKLGGRGFRVAAETHRLMCRMVAQGEMAHLTPERLGRETTRAMATDQPWHFFNVLHGCGALAALIPELDGALGAGERPAGCPDGGPLDALKRAAARSADPAVRLVATLAACVDEAAGVEPLVGRLRADRETAQMLRRVVTAAPLCERARRGDVDALVELITLWRGFDGDADLAPLLVACDAQYPDPAFGELVAASLPAGRAIDAAGLRARGLQGAALGEGLRAARRAAMQQALQAAGLIS